jgi:hypothetical protein
VYESLALASDSLALVNGPDDCIAVSCETSAFDALTVVIDGLASVNASKTIVMPFSLFLCPVLHRLVRLILDGSAASR